MRYRTLAAAAVAIVTLDLLSCDSSPLAPRLDQLSLDVVSGNGQTAVVGSELAPLIVKVTSGGNPVALQVLNFRVVSGGGSVYGGTELTDDHGIAQEIWTLGTKATEPQRVEVRAVESSTGAQKVFGTFTATATPAPASVISAQGGNGQTAVAGTALPISPTVLVTDQFGNAIGGVTVNFSVTAGGGGVVNSSQPTGANGVASAGTWTLGPQAGPSTMIATSTGLTGSPVPFTAVGTVGNATQLVVLSGNNQTASPGSTLPNQPTVRVIDANGNGVPNVAVTFTVTGGGGSMDGVGSVTTLTAGPSSVLMTGSAQVAWTLGPNAGTNTLQATAAGLSGSPRVFVATASCNCWTTKASMPTAREKMAASTINGVLYAVGGHTQNGGILATVEAYDPATDTWKTKASMPTARYLLGTAVVKGVLYAVGGSNSPTGNSDLTTVEAYDPATDTWTTKASMPTARFGLGLTAVNGILYAVGGNIANVGPQAVVEAYDPVTNTWTAKSSMHTARAYMGLTSINGIVYAIGGADCCGDVASVEAYDPATDTWTTEAPMQTVREGLGAGPINGIVYAVGGATGSTAFGTLEAYDPASNTWTMRAAMPTPRGYLGVTVVNGALYAVGGDNLINAVGTVEAYQP